MQADMHSFRLKPANLPPGTANMRAKVRVFLAENLADYPSRLQARSWVGHNETISAKVAGPVFWANKVAGDWLPDGNKRWTSGAYQKKRPSNRDLGARL